MSHPLPSRLAALLLLCAAPLGACDPHVGCAGLCEPVPPGMSWLNPLPQGEAVLDIFGFAENDVWLTGARGTVLHHDGSSIRRLATNVTQDLESIYGARPDDVWFGGTGGTLLHYDGREITPFDGAVGDIYDIWGTATDDVWLAQNFSNGALPLILHFDGSRWLPADGPDARLGSAYSGWASSRTDSWAAVSLQAHSLVRQQGTGFKPVPDSPPTGGLTFTMVRGSAADNVWFAGDQLARFDGTYHDVPMPSCLLWAWDLAVVGPRDVWLSQDAICHYDGSTWTQVLKPNPEDELISIWAQQGTRPWFGGGTGAIGRINGDQIERLTQSPMRLSGSLRALWGSNGHDLWAVGDAVLRYDGARWRSVPPPFEGRLDAVWGSAADDVWVVGQGKVARWDGSGWTVPVLPQTAGTGLWGSGPGDVWITAAPAGMLHFDGAQFSQVQAGTTQPLHAVTGSAPDAVWAVGDHGAVVRFDSVRWTSLPVVADARLVAAYSAGGERLFVSGNEGDAMSPGDGLLALWADERWSVFTGDGQKTFVHRGLWGGGNDDVWAVGSSTSGTILHYDGVRWSPLTEAPARALNGAFGLRHRVFFVGERAAILQFAR